MIGIILKEARISISNLLNKEIKIYKEKD